MFSQCMGMLVVISSNYILGVSCMNCKKSQGGGGGEGEGEGLSSGL